MLQGKMKRHWPLVCVGLLLMLLGIGFLHSERQTEEAPPSQMPQGRQGLQLKDVHYAQDDPDQDIRWGLDAREVHFSEDNRSVSFEDFRLKVIAVDRPGIRVTGKRGKYSKDSRKIDLGGDLEAVTENGYSFYTQKAVLDEMNGILTSDASVLLKGPSFSIEGKGLHCDITRRIFRVEGDVTTVIEKEMLL